MGRIKERFDKTVNIFAILIFALMVLITFLQVIGRYVFQNPPSWTEELARYLSVWLTFIGAGIAFRTGQHLGVDFFVGKMPVNLRRIVELLINLILCAVIILLIAKGFSMTKFVSKQLSPAMRISMAIPYSAIPVGGILMIIEVIINLFKSFREKGVR